MRDRRDVIDQSVLGSKCFSPDFQSRFPTDSIPHGN